MLQVTHHGLIKPATHLY